MEIKNPDVVAVTPSQLRSYLVHLRQLEYSPDTVNAHTRALHKVFRWLSSEFNQPNPMEHIRYPKTPKPKVPKAVSIADVIKLFEVCGETDMGKRDKAILAFLLDTGCRSAGLRGLTMDGLDLARHRAIVVEKGDELRTVFFSAGTADLISAWLLARNPASRYVFHSQSGGKLATDSLGLLMKRLKKRAGVTGRVNPHSFRHGFAREYILAGGDMGTLSRILGHKDIQTTQNSYAIFLTDELARQHEKFSPMNQIKPEE